MLVVENSPIGSKDSLALCSVSFRRISGRHVCKTRDSRHAVVFIVLVARDG